jgi:very-short-patch-repair endonuclease
MNRCAELYPLPFEARVRVGMGLLWATERNRATKMKGQTNSRILAPKLQRRLRDDMTDSERRLWSMLRSRQIENRKFRRRHPYERFILDFVGLDIGLVIEVDGGRHAGSATDRERDRFLQGAGFTVLQLWNHDVLENLDGVSKAIRTTVLKLLATYPHSSPPLEGEGTKPGH